MTQEEKQLLLQDLSTRLPYGVMVLEDINKEFDGGCISKLATITEIKGEKMFLTKNSLTPVTIEEIRPYLRPMSSMTKEELYEVQEILGKGVEIHDVFISIVDSSINTFSYLELQAVFEWFNAHHFDYRGLIEKGLALEALEGMY